MSSIHTHQFFIPSIGILVFILVFGIALLVLKNTTDNSQIPTETDTNQTSTGDIQKQNEDVEFRGAETPFDAIEDQVNRGIITLEEAQKKADEIAKTLPPPPPPPRIGDGL